MNIICHAIKAKGWMDVSSTPFTDDRLRAIEIDIMPLVIGTEGINMAKASRMGG